ncbi:hypothetical protein H310_09599, partial [Aphanomyces invadans]
MGLARSCSNLVARETGLVVERNSRVAAEAYEAALRDQLDTETRQAAETIGQLRSDLAVVNNKVDAWSKRFQTVGPASGVSWTLTAHVTSGTRHAKTSANRARAQLASAARGRDLILAEMARLENEVKRFKEAPSAALSPRPPSALAPVTEHFLRTRVRELEGELAAARSSAETSRTTVESRLDALRARAKDQEEALNKSAEVVGTLRDSNLALGQECDELRVRLDVAEQDALKANLRFADAVPTFWDWVVRQFAVEMTKQVGANAFRHRAKVGQVLATIPPRLLSKFLLAVLASSQVFRARVNHASHRSGSS